MNKIIRQGDVGLIPLDGPPNVAMSHVLKVEKRKLIRKGENGGVHELESIQSATIYSEVSESSLVKDLFGRFIEVREPTRVVHSEHAAVTLEPGWYEIRIQREFLGDAVRYTSD